MGPKRKAFFCELGQLDSKVMVTQGPWGKSQELLGFPDNEFTQRKA